ncbi:MAG: aminotransferase class V-fold PLP-dependent enzyme [Proteobacteria bacterium]|nr:aminotransferase class V-fold PLP-dependent enzyme [Pseudomonadota bacterium]MBU1610765.1 aminotransferase class V-fold PLP-dependent enzyme [Pseudomonadota bacterium]
MGKPERLFLSPPHMGGTELDHIHEAFAVNYISPMGPQLAAFEKRCAEITGFSHCVAVQSGTAAMHLVLRLLEIEPGDTVLASSLTFIGSVSPATFLGAKLGFIDSDRTSWNMDPYLLAEALAHMAKRGTLPKAIIPTDLYGQCADYDAINDIAAPYAIPVVVDAAEALGATYKDRHAGHGGRAAVYSFNGNKILTTGGGGVLASDHRALVEQARWLSQQARDDAPHYEHTTIGYNYRLSNIAAAIGLGQLEVLPDRIRRRREIFQDYVERLSDLPGITFMPEAAYGTHNRWLTVVQIDADTFGATPEQVRLALEAENIESRPVWKPMHLQPVFEDARVWGGAVSEELFARGLCLPSGTAMADSDLDRVADVIRGLPRA